MLNDGYGHWLRRDYTAFIRASEKYGRGDVKMIATEIDGKTYEEVVAYHQVCEDYNFNNDLNIFLILIKACKIIQKD